VLFRDDCAKKWLCDTLVCGLYVVLALFTESSKVN